MSKGPKKPLEFKTRQNYPLLRITEIAVESTLTIFHHAICWWFGHFCNDFDWFKIACHDLYKVCKQEWPLPKSHQICFFTTKAFYNENSPSWNFLRSLPSLLTIEKTSSDSAQPNTTESASRAPSTDLLQTYQGRVTWRWSTQCHLCCSSYPFLFSWIC